MAVTSVIITKAAALDQALAEGADGRFPIPEDDAFDDEPYLDAPELAEIGAALLADCPEFSGAIRDLHITYAWQRAGTTSGSRAVLGTCKPVSKLARFLSDQDYTVLIAADHCRDSGMTRRQMEALVYHELCHIQPAWDDEGRLKRQSRGHDVELFWDEVKRYGLWRADLRRTRVVFEQVPLPMGSERGK